MDKYEDLLIEGAGIDYKDTDIDKDDILGRIKNNYNEQADYQQILDFYDYHEPGDDPTSI